MYTTLTTEDIRKQFTTLYYNNQLSDDGNLEIIGSSFIANEESIFGKVDYSYIAREIKWYRSQSLSIDTLGKSGTIPKIWEQIASNKREINSNYGWCIFNPDNYYQFQNVLEMLNKDLTSRRAIMIYTRPSMHEDSTSDGMNDFMCTNTVQLLYRNNKLNMIVNMRSNDVVYGYKNDYAWQKYVLRRAADLLTVDMGDIYWQTGSLHIYPKHFYLVEEYLNAPIN